MTFSTLLRCHQQQQSPNAMTIFRDTLSCCPAAHRGQHQLANSRRLRVEVSKSRHVNLKIFQESVGALESSREDL